MDLSKLKNLSKHLLVRELVKAQTHLIVLQSMAPRKGSPKHKITAHTELSDEAAVKVGLLIKVVLDRMK